VIARQEEHRRHQRVEGGVSGVRLSGRAPRLIEGERGTRDERETRVGDRVVEETGSRRSAIAKWDHDVTTPMSARGAASRPFASTNARKLPDIKRTVLVAGVSTRVDSPSSLTTATCEQATRAGEESHVAVPAGHRRRQPGRHRPALPPRRGWRSGRIRDRQSGPTAHLSVVGAELEGCTRPTVSDEHVAAFSP